MPVSSRFARNVPSMMPTVGKFCTPEKPIALHLVEEHVHLAERIGAVDAREHRRVLDHRQHFGRHLHHDRVGVAVGHQPGERAAPGHAVAAGIVDDDQIDAAGLLAFRREARAGAAADDRLAARRPWRGIFSIRAERSNAHGYLAALRRDAAPAMHRPEGVEHGGGESRIVDVRGDAHELAGRGLPHGLFERAEQRRIGGLIVEGPPGASSAETPPSGSRKRTGASIWLSRSPIQRPMRVVLVRRGAHQRDLRIVLMEQPALVARRHGVGRAEIDHVERADRADIGNARADDRAEAVFGRRKHAAHQQVADFGGRDVDHALELTAIDQLLHRLAADAGRVEHEAVVFVRQRRGELLHAGRRDAEHRKADRRQLRSRRARAARLAGRGEPRLHHAGHRLRAVRRGSGARWR